MNLKCHKMYSYRHSTMRFSGADGHEEPSQRLKLHIPTSTISTVQTFNALSPRRSPMLAEKLKRVNTHIGGTKKQLFLSQENKKVSGLKLNPMQLPSFENGKAAMNLMTLSREPMPVEQIDEARIMMWNGYLSKVFGITIGLHHSQISLITTKFDFSLAELI